MRGRANQASTARVGSRRLRTGEQFRQTEAATLESLQLLEQIFHEQCELVDELQGTGRVKPPERAALRTAIKTI